MPPPPQNSHNNNTNRKMSFTAPRRASQASSKERQESPLSRLKMRLVICVLTTLCPTVCYVSRINLSLAIVAMVNDAAADVTTTTTESPTTTNNSELTSNLTHKLLVIDPNDPAATAGIIKDDPQDQQSPPVTYGPKYEWSQGTVGILNGAFFFTYVIFQIPAARLAEQLGAKWILAVAALGSSILSLLSPLAASLDVWAFICVRLAMGVCQTALYPAAYILYCKWLPPTERSFALPILYAAAYFGAIISSLATGYLCEIESLGWEYSFYLPGVVCLIWTLIWIPIASSTPRENHLISIEELEYIESNLESGLEAAANNDNVNKQKQQKPNLSWNKMISSQPVWALIYGFIASNWAFSIILLILPTYLNNVIGVSTLKNGIVNAVIFGVYCVACPLVGTVSTMMVETRAFGLKRLQMRKLFQSIALFGQTICFIILPHIQEDKYVFLLLLTQIVLFSFVNGGEVQIPSELSHDYSGTIYALCNSAGSATGFILPPMQTGMVTDKHSRDQYATFFYCSAAIIANNAFVFLIFGRNDPQNFSSDTIGTQIYDDDFMSDDEIEIEKKKNQVKQATNTNVSPNQMTNSTESKVDIHATV